MKQKSSKRLSSKGFTLLELLVVVLIIGILASIALPQYEMAVTKAKVASILPIMRRWKDALAEYKLQHGSYEDLDDATGGATLGVSWPSDWKHNGEPCGDNITCINEYWSCYANSGGSGQVYCSHSFDEDGEDLFFIVMYQPDDHYTEEAQGMLTCQPGGAEPINATKVCKALGGKLLEGVSDFGPVYQL